jgi:uncharacterized membrane protein
MQVWLLSVAYWLHMAATVVWLGGLFVLAVALPPEPVGAGDRHPHDDPRRPLQARLQPLSWLSLALLIGTGLLQMSANPHYEGFLTIANRWSLAILAKHLTFILMIAVTAYQTWRLGPELERIGWLRAKRPEETDPGAVATLQARMRRLSRLNLALAVIVLALTALARTA